MGRVYFTIVGFASGPRKERGVVERALGWESGLGLALLPTLMDEQPYPISLHQ